MTVHRVTTIQRLEYDPNPTRRANALGLPGVVLASIVIGAVILAGEPPVFWVMVACTSALLALWMQAERLPSRPGGVDVITSPGALVSRSRRGAAFYAAGMIVLALLPLGLWLYATLEWGLSSRLAYNLFALLFLVGAGAALWRLSTIVRSADLRFDAAGVTVSGPGRTARTLAWDDITTATGSRTRLTVARRSSESIAIDVRAQRTDHAVLVEIIQRCAEHPAARERLGDLILGDMLLNAAPDGTEPPHPDRIEKHD